MTNKILFVDDEPNVLAAFERIFRRDFDLEVARSGAEALEKIANSGPYAVVLSDMRMPNMTGAELLSLVRDVAPNTVRMVLTGETDIASAVQAVNEGAIFRFLLKPCPEPMLRSALESALRLYGLQYAERDLLEKTLSGSVKVLAELLSLVNPAAFGKSVRIQRYVRHITDALKLHDTWQFEVAAMLSQIGCVTLPPHTLESVYAGQQLPDGERGRYLMHTSIAHDLLVQVPRLEGVAMMICRQDEPFSSAPGHDHITLGAQILKVCLAFDQLVTHGADADQAITEMRAHAGEYSPRLLDALADVRFHTVTYQPTVMPIEELETGMLIDQDIRTHTGLLLVARGQEATYPMLVRLLNFHQHDAIPASVRVLALKPALQSS